MVALLRRLLDRLSFNPRLRTARRERSTRFSLERLEDRLAPATVTWTGAGAVPALAHPNDNFSDPQNWVGNFVPQNGDALVFPTAPTAKTRLANNDLVGKTFASITISGDGYQITGNSVKLSGGISNTFGYNIVALPLTLTAGQTFSDVKGSFLEVSGSINNGGFLLTLNSNSGNILFDGSAISGSGGLLVKGDNYSGNVFLDDTAPDTYTGVTTIIDAAVMYLGGAQGDSVVGNLVAGTGPGPNESDCVHLAQSNEIADTSSVTVLANGLFDLNGYDNTIASLTMCGGFSTTGSGTLTINGNITTQASSTTAVIEGNLSFGTGTATRTITVATGTAGVDLNMKAAVSAGAKVSLVKAGTGTMWLTASNSDLGTMLISAGTVWATDADALSAADTTVTSVATLILKDSQADSSFTFASDPLTLNGGTLVVNSNSATVVFPGTITLAASSTIEVNPGNTLDVTGQVGGSGGLTKAWAGDLDLSDADTTTGAITVNGGIMALDNSQALGSSTVKVSGQAMLVLDDGINCANSLTLAGTLLGNGDATWSGPIALINSATLAAAVGETLTVSGTISGPAADTLTVSAADGGSVVLSAANTYTGATIVSNGILAIANATALGKPAPTATTKAVTVDAGATLQLQGGVTFAKADVLTLNGFGVNGAGALEDSNGNDTWAGNIILNSNTTIGADAGTTLTITGVISGGFNDNVSYVGDGTVVLAAADTYQGYSTVAAGILALDNAQALTGAPISGGRGTGVDSGATLELEANVTYALDPVQLSGSGVGGIGALYSSSGSNTWIGPVILEADATIGAAAGATLTINAATKNSGYTLTVAGAGNVDMACLISGSGGVTMNGTGTLTYSNPAPNIYSGATVINSGTLLLAKSSHVAAIGGSGVTINAKGTLAGAGIIDADVTNKGTLSPGGTGATGTLTINGNYTQTSTGTMDIELSANAIDQVLISKTATLAGTLDGGLLNGFVPSSGQKFAVMTFTSLSGQFDTVNLPSGLSLLYDAQDVTIKAN